MSYPFALGAWRAEWSTVASSSEVQTFFETYYAAERPQEFNPLTAAEATELLAGQDASALFGPDVQIAGFVHSTGWGDSGNQEALLIVVEADGRYSWQGFFYTNAPFVRPQLEVAAPPAGLIYREAGGGIYQIQSEGSGVWLLAADGSSQLLIDAEGHDPLWLGESQLAFGANGQPFLYDVTAEQTFKLDLPEGSWLLGLASEDAVSAAAESGQSAAEDSQAGMPDPETLTSTIEQFTSPDGRWQATVAQTEPVVTDDGDKFFASLTVTDGTKTWQPVAEWRGYGLGLAFPTVYQWSADGNNLYFTNKIQADGCALFANATDLYRLNLAVGIVDTILDTGLTWNIGLSPDETKLAYTYSNGQAIVLEVRDLFNATQESVTVVEDAVALQGGAIIWSPDGTQLALTVAHDPCSQNWTHSIIRVDVATLTAVPILEKDARRLVTVEWSEQQAIRLVDFDKNGWVMSLDSGELMPEN